MHTSWHLAGIAILPGILRFQPNFLHKNSPHVMLLQLLAAASFDTIKFIDGMQLGALLTKSAEVTISVNLNCSVVDLADFVTLVIEFAVGSRQVCCTTWNLAGHT